jgi:hypothetical protein
MRFSIIILVWIIGAAGLISPANGLACPIPVFRYALEFWDTDPYEIIIFYEDSLDSSGRELVNFLFAASRGGEVKANLEVRNINTRNNTDEIAGAHLNSSSPHAFPWVLVRYPRISGINKTIWSGPLNRQNVDFMINSPARETIAGKLAGNATAVWVMVESGNRQKDRAAMDILKSHLNRLEQTLILPDVELWWKGSEQDGNKPVIKFETISISRNDPREAHFVNMLMNSEEDLNEFGSEPVIFPVYGRGVALWAIVGSGINEWNISEAAEFLTGPCSCQVKLLNPGTDLLMMMDWDKNVRKITDLSISNPLSGISEFGSRESETRIRLEKATIERLGTATSNRKNDENQARVIYLDIFGNSAGSHLPEDGVAEDTNDTGDTGNSGDSGGKVSERARATGNPGETGGDKAGVIKDKSNTGISGGTGDAGDAGDTGGGTSGAGKDKGNAGLKGGTGEGDSSASGRGSGSLVTAGRFNAMIYIFAGFISIILLTGFLLYHRK